MTFSGENGVDPQHAEEEVPKPSIKIDNEHDPFATIVCIGYGDRLGELLDTVSRCRQAARFHGPETSVFAGSLGWRGLTVVGLERTSPGSGALLPVLAAGVYSKAVALGLQKAGTPSKCPLAGCGSVQSFQCALKGPWGPGTESCLGHVLGRKTTRARCGDCLCY